MRLFRNPTLLPFFGPQYFLLSPCRDNRTRLCSIDDIVNYSNAIQLGIRRAWHLGVRDLTLGISALVSLRKTGLRKNSQRDHKQEMHSHWNSC
jgi:hypothetical protein